MGALSIEGIRPGKPGRTAQVKLNAADDSRN